jgi:hypothetical protein
MLLLSSVSCGPPPSKAPRTTGVESRAYVREAELLVRYRYAPLTHFEIDLYVDLSAQGGDIGEVSVSVDPGDFAVKEGPLSWTTSLSSGETHSDSVRLRSVVGDKPRVVTVTTTRVNGQIELARDTIRFIVDEDAIRECEPSDAVCGQI